MPPKSRPPSRRITAPAKQGRFNGNDLLCHIAASSEISRVQAGEAKDRKFHPVETERVAFAGDPPAAVPFGLLTFS